jgi:hypothetical protein
MNVILHDLFRNCLISYEGASVSMQCKSGLADLSKNFVVFAQTPIGIQPSKKFIRQPIVKHLAGYIACRTHVVLS